MATEMKTESEEEKNKIDVLPEECIANILLLTDPVDSCKFSIVSKDFCSASESDIVWEHFLPSDLISIISESQSGSSLLATSPSKKSLYLTLSDNPIIIDNGKKSFQLEKQSGKKIYMLSARDLSITWGDTPTYWNWIILPESSTDTQYRYSGRGALTDVELEDSVEASLFTLLHFEPVSLVFL
ncbi:F-box protein PP2-B1 isoform X2 [Lathyrus oleraceus]|uniref:F-box domain-containing protein n=1 Tax=Pisum sativum TaxID=3888 RepID=A0A9D4W8L2_PEA|nr:F-box protein PP2-B1-like isoform X2 [Pisum sativum]KAI5398159.1 hypothetical protein KIW84_063813 [Pisum sativum]